jgi:Asp-tRNA(Asn)/Glu-tRNA(Gln) amidotransferase A subunit family amidase
MSRKRERRSASLDRRGFVKSIATAGLAAPFLDFSIASAAPEQQTLASQRVTREMLHAAEQLIGIELTDAQEAMALPRVNGNLSSYEALRKIDVPLDTEPAASFHPALPGKKYGARSPAADSSRKASSRKGSKSRARPLEFKSIEDLAFLTAVELGELVRTKKVSSVELTRMYLSRLKRFGPKLLCTVTLTEELAMKQAEQADREIKLGKYRGPLHGIPWGAKDLFATKGIRTTWGAEPYRDQIIDYDATVVEKLREAGAVLIAKLSLGALAQGPRWFGGVTRSPWQPENDQMGSSGSSAGPAAATAAGLVGFSLGTETLGSIVSPSSRCGCTGLRPTYGRVSRYGAMGLSWTMDKIGPICRGVEDCAVALDAIYGPDGRDITVGDVPFHWNANRALSEMKIGYLKAEFETGSDERKKVYEEALAALRAAGAKLEPIELPRFSTDGLRIILIAEAAAAFDDITRNGAVNQLSGQAPGDWPNSFRVARFIPAVEYIRAQRARTLLMREMDKLMSSWDVFVSAAPGSASLLITNLTGHPQVCMPCGFINKQPSSIMFTGGLYDEAAPLRVALAYEKATKWHTMHPNVDWA